MRDVKFEPGTEIMTSAGQFHRIPVSERREITCRVDGKPISVFEGDTVLTAVLTFRRDLREFEFSSDLRSGFCLMGACQDCWVRKSNGERIRACSTLVADGQEIVTQHGGKTDG
ncbi:(2Fe-2S)-binding protein [Aliirhizobium smilacinae]|nr:(2Fe-2S)-binding protein [Rhizobium smilacinae]